MAPNAPAILPSPPLLTIQQHAHLEPLLHSHQAISIRDPAQAPSPPNLPPATPPYTTVFPLSQVLTSITLQERAAPGQVCSQRGPQRMPQDPAGGKC